jgi:hypothetical protein
MTDHDHSLDALAAEAKAHLLADQEHPFTLIVDGARGRVVIALDGLPDDAVARQLLMHHIAVAIPQNRRRKQIGELQQVACITETWGVTMDPAAYVALTAAGGTVVPSQHAERVEFLSISTYDVGTGVQQGREYEMLRTAGGAVHDLLAHGDVLVLSNALLEAFVAGWRGQPVEVARD